MRSPFAGSIRQDWPTPSSPVSMAATRGAVPADQFGLPAPSSYTSMRRAIRSSGSVVTTQIWVRSLPSGATWHASQ